MATININVPDATASRVVHALCKSAGLEESSANAKKALLDWIKATVYSIELFEGEESRPIIPNPDVAQIVS